MKVKTLIVAVLSALAVCMAIIVLSTKGTASEAFFDANVEAVASSEGYPLKPCMMMGVYGDYLIDADFCAPLTCEYLFISCGTYSGYVSEQFGRCVKD